MRKRTAENPRIIGCHLESEQSRVVSDYEDRPNSDILARRNAVEIDESLRDLCLFRK